MKINRVISLLFICSLSLSSLLSAHIVFAQTNSVVPRDQAVASFLPYAWTPKTDLKTIVYSGVSDNRKMISQYLKSTVKPADIALYKDIQAFTLDRVDNIMKTVHEKQFPVRGYGEKEWSFDGVNRNWTASFYTGMLWESYRITKNAKYMDEAIKRARQISVRKDDAWTHDHGFLFGLSHIKGLSYIKDQKIRKEFIDDSITAAKTYISKSHPGNGFISWHNRIDSQSVIDSMMNVPFTWWASEQTGDSNFAKIGLLQTNNILKYMIRADGSSSHGVDFHPVTGKNVEQRTYQGYSDTSCWSRGQAWAIHGYAVVYAKTGNMKYCETSRKLADYFMSHLPKDNVPWWDFNDPDIPDTVRDTSAGSVTASGLIILSLVEKDPVLAKKHINNAIKLLNGLSSTEYLTKGTGVAEILRHGCQFYNRDLKDNGLIFGDYYYMEALNNLLDLYDL